MRYRKEKERKFLLREDGIGYTEQPGFGQHYESEERMVYDVLSNGVHLEQGYLPLPVALSMIESLDLDLYTLLTQFDLTTEDLAERLIPGQDDRSFVARLRRSSEGTYELSLRGNGYEEKPVFEDEVSESLFNDYWDETKGHRVEKLRLTKRPIFGVRIDWDLLLDRDLMVVEYEVADIAHFQGLLPPGVDVTMIGRYKMRNLAR